MLVFSKKGVVTNTSILSGKTRTMKTSATAEQIEKWLGGMLIQDAMPNISVNEREFIMTGITPEEWDSVCDEEKHTLVTTNNNITKE